MAFQRAVKSKSKLRMAIFGPSGSGKTYTALAIGTGMVTNKMALIDSERSSASKYADKFVFDTCDLEEKTVSEYIANIEEAAKAGYDVLVIDSSSHAWQELLDEIELISKTKYKGNSWSAWKEGTPKQRKFIDAILNYPGHVIVTMRSKTEWEVQKDTDGKVKPVRIGLSPEQGKGIEYEFDFLMEITPEHAGNMIKARAEGFQDRLIDKPGVALGKELIAWLNSGAEPVINTTIKKANALEKVLKAFDDATTEEELEKVIKDTKKISALDEQEKVTAREAYTKKLKELKTNKETK